jgi:hypothetical protein
MSDADRAEGGKRPTLGARAATFLRSWFWPGVAILAVLGFLLVVVRPFTTPPDPDADDVATAWNESIQRLGIFPIYPPAEDIYVGDVWAVISKASPDSTTAQTETAESRKSTLLGKSMRIGYIDLRDEMVTANRRPVFDETSERKSGYRRQSPLEVDVPAQQKRISLALAAFPGITITHKVKSAASFGWNFGGIGGDRDDQRVEEIRIPVAETYGVPISLAFFRLDQWCSDSKTKIYCSDEYVRRIMAFGVSNGVLATVGGKYTTQIELRLITRVYLMREIEHRRVSGAAGTAALRISGERAQPKDGAAKAPEPGSPSVSGGPAARRGNQSGGVQ